MQAIVKYKRNIYYESNFKKEASFFSFRPYTGEYGSVKDRFLTYFMQCLRNDSPMKLISKRNYYQKFSS